MSSINVRQRRGGPPESARLIELDFQIDAALVSQHKTIQKEETIVQMENGALVCITQKFLV